MLEPLSWLNNRDLSILVWLSVLLISVLVYKPTRPHVLKMAKIITTTQLGTIFLLCLLYTQLIVLGLLKLGYWEVPLFKEAIVWLIGFAFYSTFKVSSQKNYSQYFKGLVWDAIKLTTVLEFITNFYVLSLIGELILVPIIAFISILITYSEHMQKEDSEYRKTAKLFNGLLIVIVLYVLYKGVISFINEPNLLFTWFSLKEFLLPIILTIFFIPLLYAMAYYMYFESLAIRLSYSVSRDEKLARYAKWKMFLKSHLNLQKLMKIEDKVKGQLVSSKKEFNLLLSA